MCKMVAYLLILVSVVMVSYYIGFQKCRIHHGSIVPNEELYNKPVMEVDKDDPEGRYVVYRDPLDVRVLWVQRQGKYGWKEPIKVPSSEYLFCWAMDIYSDGEVKLWLIKSEREFPTSAEVGDQIGLALVGPNKPVRSKFKPFLLR